MKKVITTMSALSLTVPSENANATDIDQLTQDELTVVYGEDSSFKGSGFVDLSVTKTVMLTNNQDLDGVVTAGDQLTYHIMIENMDAQNAVDGVFVVDVIDSKTDLILGTVSSTLGQVQNGNLPGDSNDLLTVDIPTIPADWFAIINFDVLVGELDDGPQVISNSAEVYGPSGSFFLSDDPNTSVFDPTMIDAQGPTPELIFQNGFDRVGGPSGGF